MTLQFFSAKGIENLESIFSQNVDFFASNPDLATYLHACSPRYSRIQHNYSASSTTLQTDTQLKAQL